MRKTTLLVLTILVGGMLPTPPASGVSLWSAACALNLRFDFNSPIRATGTAPGYDLIVTASQDLDPQAGGLQTCASTVETAELLRSTIVDADGSSSLWSCSAVLASGNWDQEWVDSGGDRSPPSLEGGHTIAGTWGDWQLVVRDQALTTVGVGQFTVDARDADLISDCPLVGVTTLRMTGAVFYQDP